MGSSSVAEKQAVQNPDSIVEKLVEYGQSICYERLNEAAIHEVKRRLIDSFACAFGAYLQEPPQIARLLAQSVQSNNYGSSVIGLYNLTSPDMAAFANGLMFRYLDYNDTYLSLEPAHPADNLAALMALAEPSGCSGKNFIAAAVLAYEIQCRLCDAASIRARGWDHVTYGGLSATLGCTKVLELDATASRHAMAIAGGTNINLRQTRIGELSHWKGAAFANVSKNAVFAARLADLGMTGLSHLFEGEKGLIKQVTGPLTLGDWGGENNQDYMINQTYIKFWPAEYHSQSAIDAALKLRAQLESTNNVADQIESILIESFDAAVDIIGGEEEKWFPKSRETADHSLPYCTAVALIDGEVTLRQFDDHHLADPVLSSLIQKIKIQRAEDLNPLYPEGIPNRITIKLKNGNTLMETVTFPRGHAKNPMTDEEVEEKFRRLSSTCLPKKTQDEILSTLWNLEAIQDWTDDLMGYCII